MTATGRIFQTLLGLISAILLIACGVGPGLSRYVGAAKTVLAVLPDLCLATLILLAIFIPGHVGAKKTGAWIAAWAFLGWVAVVAVPSVGSLGEQGVYGLRSVVWGLVIAMLLQSKLVSGGVARVLQTLVLLVLLANMLVALVQAVVGLSATELQTLIEAGASYQVESQTRLLGLQATGQELSMFAGSGFVWACATVVNLGFRRSGVLVWSVGILSAVVTLVVLQRSALIGAFAALAILVVSMASRSYHGRRGASARRFASVAGAAMVAIAALAVLSPDRVDLAISRFQTLFGLSTDYSFSVRQGTTLPVALKLLGEQPLGYGLGSSGPVAAKYAPAGPLADFPLGGIAADNGYLYMALQVGIPGVLFFGVLLASWITCGGFVRVAPRDRLAPRVVLVYLAAIMLSGSFWGLTGSMAVVVMLASVNISSLSSVASKVPIDSRDGGAKAFD